jgi:branched-subunit amino acid transport protein
MTTEETLKPEQSLQVINTMIHAAKNKLADDGFHFIFWGWLVTLCAVTHYVTIKLGFNWGPWVWMAMPIGGVVSGIYGYKQGRKVKVKTYLDTYLAYVWIGFLAALFITLVFGYAHGIKATYFFLMLLYGIATFITGGILNFKPLIFGSLFSFAFAIASVFLGEMDQFLCISGALLCSYIIPGHLLRSKYRSQNV